MTACWGKISISLLVSRMIHRKRAYKIFLWTLIFLLFITNILVTIITFTQCTPASWLWDQLDPTLAGYRGSCWDPLIQKYYRCFQGGMVSTALLRYVPGDYSYGSRQHQHGRAKGT